MRGGRGLKRPEAPRLLYVLLREKRGMPLIPADKAKAGMVLAEPVRDRRGRLLLPAGKVLEERYLEALPMWGVTHIAVEGGAGADDAEAPQDPWEALEPWAVAQATHELEEVFAHANCSHPLLALLHRTRVLRRALALQRGGGKHDP